MSVISRAYDGIAPLYDQEVQTDAWIREQLATLYSEQFGPGDRLLELGCGTGIDTEFLARMGCAVTAVDLSPKMLELHGARLTGAGLRGSVETRHMDVADIGTFDFQSFDGILSGFGTANTTALDRLASGSARVLKPGGWMILHLVGPSSLWERLHLLRRGRLARAARLGKSTTRRFNISGVSVRHTLQRPRDMYERYFAPYFELEDCFAMGVLRPPSHIRIPSTFLSALTLLELRLRHVRPFLNWGRFYVLVLRRRV